MPSQFANIDRAMSEIYKEKLFKKQLEKIFI